MKLNCPEPASRRRRQPGLSAWGVRIVSAAVATVAALHDPGPCSAETVPLGPFHGSHISLAGARIAWELQLPLKYTDTLRDWRLVDGYLYALIEDGTVHAIRADTGRPAWIRQVAPPLSLLWGPTAATLQSHGRVTVFTLGREVVIFEPDTGREIQRITPSRPNTAAALAAGDRWIQCQVGQRFQCARLPDNLPLWAKTMPGSVALPPILVPVRGGYPWVACADTRGTLATIELDGTNRFVQDLNSAPVGGLAADAHAVYVATRDRRLRAISRTTGDLLWSLRLAGIPSEAPIVIGDMLYQATADAGLYRVALPEPPPPPLQDEEPLSDESFEADVEPSELESKPDVLAGLLALNEPTHWRAPDVHRFLAEWPHRVVVQRYDGLIALMHKDDARPRTDALLDPGPGFKGLSNAFNDAILLATPTGYVKCWRPEAAPPLTLADFRLPADVPAATEPSPDENSAPPPAPSPETTALTSEHLLLADSFR